MCTSTGCVKKGNPTNGVIDGPPAHTQMTFGQPGLCIMCGTGQRAVVCDPLDNVYYSHVCTQCQDQHKAYYPCVVCKREIDYTAPGMTPDASDANMCAACFVKIGKLLAMGFTMEKIMASPQLEVQPPEQVELF